MPSPSLFSEKSGDEPWRELTMAEKRADVVTCAEEERDEAREFAAMLAEGGAEIVADLKKTVERIDSGRTPTS